MLLSLKKRVCNFLLRNLFNAVTEESFLQVKNGKVFEGKRELSIDQAREYAKQAAYILNYDLFRKLFDSIRWKSNEQMYYKSRNEFDMLFGKAMLHTLNMIEEKLRSIKDFEPSINPKKK